ncbi:hypothetical protein ABZ820_22225 [Streptomyces diacarni]|uniref:hypothetical protein n=1 Tax=Streptomyces diacarni TaxID=2800381 RepID=UPI0033DC2148
MNTASLRRAAHSLASTASTAGTAVALTAGALVAYGTHRLTPARFTGGGRILAAGTAGLATTVLLDDIVWDALEPLRHRTRPTASTHTRPMAPLSTLDDAIAHLTVDTENDAAQRAAQLANFLDYSDGLLRDARRWRGYPNGEASCYLAPGMVLHCQRQSSAYGARYHLLTCEADQPIRITTLAQLRQHLEAKAAGVPVAAEYEHEEPRAA